MRNIIVLNGPKNLSPFVRKVMGIIDADAIMWMDDFDQNIEYEKGVKNIPFGTKLNQNITLYVFDIFLTPTLLVLKKYERSRKVFVQHGAFSDLLVEQRQRGRDYEWLKRSMINAWRFLRIFGIKFETFFLLVKIFRFGPWFARKDIENLKLEIDYGIFWSQKEVNELQSSNIVNIDKYILCKSPDADVLKLKHCSHGRVVYIGQPLVEDLLITSFEYNNFLDKMRSDYGEDLVFISHPRQFGYRNGIGLQNIIEEIDCKLVIGHFSSLLLSVPDDIPLIYETFNSKDILKYSKYIRSSKHQVKRDLISFSNALKSTVQNR